MGTPPNLPQVWYICARGKGVAMCIGKTAEPSPEYKQRRSRKGIPAGKGNVPVRLVAPPSHFPAQLSSARLNSAQHRPLARAREGGGGGTHGPSLARRLKRRATEAPLYPPSSLSLLSFFLRPTSCFLFSVSFSFLVLPPSCGLASCFFQHASSDLLPASSDLPHASEGDVERMCLSPSRVRAEESKPVALGAVPVRVSGLLRWEPVQEVPVVVAVLAKSGAGLYVDQPFMSAVCLLPLSKKKKKALPSRYQTSLGGRWRKEEASDVERR